MVRISLSLVTSMRACPKSPSKRHPRMFLAGVQAFNNPDSRQEACGNGRSGAQSEITTAVLGHALTAGVEMRLRARAPALRPGHGLIVPHLIKEAVQTR
jgi:hypothetical protein